MDKTITSYESLEELKAAELREWQALPAYERLRVVSELTLAVYRLKDPSLDVPRLERTLIQVQREKR
jgi:hypothetical protein